MIELNIVSFIAWLIVAAVVGFGVAALIGAAINVYFAEQAFKDGVHQEQMRMSKIIAAMPDDLYAKVKAALLDARAEGRIT